MQPRISIITPIYNAEDTLSRALLSIPLDKDYQVILIDDGSTDRSWEIALGWYNNYHGRLHNSSLAQRWTDNRGVAAAMNAGFDAAEGEYIVSLSSDDYYLSDFKQFEPYLDGQNDLVYFDLQVNDGSVWHITPENKKYYPGAVKFMRRKFLGDTRIPDLKWEEDVPFSQALQAKNPKEVFTGIALKHYSWPREGSLTWQKEHQKTEQK